MAFLNVRDTGVGDKNRPRDNYENVVTILKHIRTQAWALRVALIEISCETSRERFESASVFQYGKIYGALHI